MSNATTTNGKAPSQDVVAVIVGALAAMGLLNYMCKNIYKFCVEITHFGGI